ncbi:MAG: endonuclease III [Candidatus Parvarchaeota archaeon]|nr:endonuclease III [Candidatus Rehaiarchaeum fermentans]
MLKDELEKEFKILKRKYNITEKDFVAPYVFKKYKDPKLTLISIILSQNSTDKSALKAFENLYQIYNKNPSEKEIIRRIRVCGLAKQKAAYIKEIMNLDYKFFDNILKEKEENARKTLTNIKGIGEKTADVFLSLYGKNVFPVDRHIMRIGKRLGIGKNYREISRYFLKELGKETKYHLMLISHGRYICKAKNPLCNECYLRNNCNYYKTLDRKNEI